MVQHQRGIIMMSPDPVCISELVAGYEAKSYGPPCHLINAHHWYLYTRHSCTVRKGHLKTKPHYISNGNNTIVGTV